jgi:acyl-CoA thioesterase
MSEERRWPPAYFGFDDGYFIPTGLARSPWNPRAIAGGPVSALLATIAEDAALDDSFVVARFSVDIFGIVPHQPLTAQITPLREGRQTLLHRVEIVAGDRPAAQAHILRVRRADTPIVAEPHDYPAPDSCEERDWLVQASMAGAIRTRPLRGAVGDPGRGIGWLSMDGEVVAGTTPSGTVKAALFADFGNGIGSATRPDEWSFANLDITLQFYRMPVGRWFLIDAETHMAGAGHGVAKNVFADEQGVYARGFQTVFVAPSTGVR